MFWIVRMRRWRETAWRHREWVSDFRRLRGLKGEAYVRIEDRVIVHEFLEHQVRVRFKGGVEREEDLAMLLNGQVLDKVQPIWVITVSQMPHTQRQGFVH